MPLTTTVDDAEVQAAFNALRLRISAGGQRRALSDIGRYGKSSTQLRFRSQVGPDGQRWKPSKRAEREGGQTLRKTSRLRNSIEWQVDSKGVSWGTNVAYAPAHQFGFEGTVRVRPHIRMVKKVYGRKLKKPVKVYINWTTRRTSLVARPFLGLNDADRAAILGMLSNHLTGDS